MDKCITIGLGEDLIKRLADLLIEQSKGSPDLSRTLCVFSNRRASLFLIKELSKRLGSSFFPPKMMIDDDLAEEIVRSHTEYSVMPSQESQYIIYNLAKKHAPSLVRKRPGFADFISWAQEIASFIDQLDMEAVDDKALSDLKTHARIGLSVPASINQLLKNIGYIREELHKEMEKRKQYSRGYTYLKAAELFEEKDISGYENILVCNFFYMQRTEKEIFKRLFRSGKASLIFQGDANDWPTLKENSAEFGVNINSTVDSRSSNACLYEATDKHAEAGIVKELMKKMVSPGSDTVIVLPEYDALLPVIAQVSQHIGEFNISMGYRLTRSSIYYLLMSIFKAQNSRKKNGHYYSKDYLEVLMHPIAKNWEGSVESKSARILVHNIEESLSSLFVSPEDIEKDSALLDLAADEAGGGIKKEDLKNSLLSLHDTLFRNWEDIQTFSQLASAVSSYLDEAGKLGLLKSHPMNYAVVESLYEKCDEIKNSSFADEVFSKDELMRIFDEMMSFEKVDFLGTPLKGVQVLGLFQTHSISFDNVVILDANEGSLPKVRVSEPLIPREAMLMVGLRRLEKTEEIEKYQFRRLIASSKNAHIIYRNDDRSERSRFVEELLLEQERSSALQRLNSTVPRIVTAAFNINPIPGKSIIKKTNRQAEFLKQFEYSPSAVNTYLACPAQFYYSYVLRLREQDDKLEQIEGRDIGTFVHELLEEAYTPFKGQRPVLDNKFKTMFLAMLDRKFKTEFSKRIRSGDFMLRETLKAAMDRFLSCERGRNIEEVLELEKKYKTKIVVGKTELIMKGTVDRIDKMGSGEIMVLDYKTGSSDIKPSTKIDVVSGAIGDRSVIKKKIKSLQLPIYISLVCDKYDLEVLNPALYSIKDSELVSLWEDKHDAAQRKELYQAYMSALNSILEEIIDPSKGFEPDESDDRICSNCPFSMMCR